MDANGDAYVVGQTLSTNFPTLIPDYPVRNGTNDAFLTKIMLTVPPPTITAAPISQTVAVGSTATFAVGGSAYAPYFFQWQEGTNLVGTNLVDARNISGATNYTLIITNAQINNSGFYYQVIIMNNGGAVTSSVALLTVTNVPLSAIAVQPMNQTNGVGTTAIFVVTVTNGTAPLSYQWQWTEQTWSTERTIMGQRSPPAA